MHNIKLIRRRFPQHANIIIGVMAVLICILLTLGVGLLILL